MNVVLRELRPEDHAFIYSTWTKQDWHERVKHTIPHELRETWWDTKSREIKQSLEEDEVCIACPDDEPWLVVGYGIHRNGKLIWRYVKRDYRGKGIEKLIERGRCNGNRKTA